TTPASDLAFSADGRALFFVHRAAHILDMDGLILSELGNEGENEHGLVVSTLDNSWAVSNGECDRNGSVEANALDLRAEPGSPFADHNQGLEPVGWLAGTRLVVAARPSGCDGPADVWVWSGAGAVHSFQHLGSGWDGISVRTAHGPFVDLPAEIDEA